MWTPSSKNEGFEMLGTPPPLALEPYSNSIPHTGESGLGGPIDTTKL